MKSAAAKKNAGEKANQKFSESLIKLGNSVANAFGDDRPTPKKRKAVKTRREDDLRALWGPFFVIFGRILCLLIVIPTAIMEGFVIGFKHAVTVTSKRM